MITNNEIYKNILPAPKVSTVEAKKPPTIFAIKDAISHTPINRDANLGGANFVTTESPTGDKHNSPIV